MNHFRFTKFDGSAFEFCAERGAEKPAKQQLLYAGLSLVGVQSVECRGLRGFYDVTHLWFDDEN